MKYQTVTYVTRRRTTYIVKSAELVFVPDAVVMVIIAPVTTMMADMLVLIALTPATVK